MRERLELLRADFDDAFARPLEAPVEHRELLVIGCGDERVALPLDGLVGVDRASAVTPLPSPHAALLGLANHRGAVVAVFSLAALLGSAERQQTADQTWSSPLPMASRWFALVASSALAPTEKIALAFEHLVERVRLPIAKDAPRVAFYRTERGVIPILDPAELVARVTANTVAGQET